MAQKNYTVKSDGDSVLITVSIVNNTTAKVDNVSVVFDAFDANLTYVTNYKDVGTYTAGTRTWDGISLKPGENQVLYVKFNVVDVYLLPVTITATITNAVDGDDGAGTALSFTITNEDKEDNYTTYSALLTQTGTDAPTAVGMSNTIGTTYTLARTNAGIYTITADSGTPFTAGKTQIFLSSNGATAIGRLEAVRTSSSVITIQTLNETFTLADALLSSTAIEIRVYGTPVLL